MKKLTPYHLILNAFPQLKLLFVLICLLGFISTAFGQSFSYRRACGPEIHRFHIGTKVGTPGLATLGAEFVSPLLGNRLAPFVEYSRFGIKRSRSKINNRFLEYGVNLYFSEEGRKGYLAISRSHLNLQVSDFNGESTTHCELPFEGTNVKLGGRWGRRVYFRVEAGYTFGKVMDRIRYEERLSDGSVNNLYEEIPKSVHTFTQMGLPVFNIGVGVSL